MTFPNLIIFFWVTGILSATALFLWYWRKLGYQALGPKILNSVFLEVLVPKETTAMDKEQEAVKEEKEIIGIAEQLFTTLSHTERGGVLNLRKVREVISLEIMNLDKKITFLINCPKRLRDLVEKQVHAQYPNAQIDEVLPPRLILNSRGLAAAELSLQKKFLFPIKTYKYMESDPLNALTNSLSKLSQQESGTIQMVLKPAALGWRHRVLQAARQIQKGKPVWVEGGTIQKAASYFFETLGELGSSLFAPKKKPETLAAAKKDRSLEPQPLTPVQQEAVKRLEEKASKSGFEVNLRIMISSHNFENAASHLQNVLSSFMQYSQPPFNGFRVLLKNRKAVIRDLVFRRFRRRWFGKVILNTEEMASLFHLPTRFTHTPNIKWLSAKRAPAPVNVPSEGLLLGVNFYRGVKTEIRIGPDDRRRHMYIIGRTGTGKSEFIKGMARQDIEAGSGLAVLDPHGDLIDDLLSYIPKNRVEDVILFEPFDMTRPMGLNMLEVKSDEEKDFAVQEMIAIFYKLFPPEIIGPMFEHNMRNVMLTLMADQEYPGTIAEIPRMFTDSSYQKYKVAKVRDPVVRAFWEQEMAKTTEFHKSEMLGYLISKVGRFVENEMMRNIIGQARSAFDFRELMDERKILLINLSKGKTGEVNSKLLGLIIVSKLQMAALSRADLPETERRDFYLYIDEFQNFVTDSLATILSEARKYHLCLVMAHQYIGQLVHENNTKIRDAVFGNAGTIVCFRIGVEDAETMAKEFAPVFNEFDVINIDRFNAYVKLMVHGTGSRSFNMQTLPPPEPGFLETAHAIRQLAKLKYGRPRDEVEAEILERARLGQLSPPGFPGIERTP